ncbi:PREDICTED: neurogenic protein big brain [Trachymyrmex cornetzi]|uniref:Neurogenic protein big brain n=1 Tax=Trachymyrmex cornetzi TaxID=471704 RepID=A0A195D8W8_9HYME|nr:PREDICTED: neurogenic protein big brain [Trachymyrmex cornetzi]KYN08869.1 Neurogenic protein big brain [Trachymyrmex cornetzi]
MANETLAREVDAHIVTILSRLSAFRENNADVTDRKAPMSVEARSLELWRAVAVECLATFLFSLVVAGAAAASAVSGSGLSALATAVASGFAIAAISLIFSHISGGHVNPAVSVSFALCRRISPLRAVLYVAAQCGGGIAGAAMLYGVTTPSSTQTLTSPGRLGGPVERLLIEIALSVFIVLAHFSVDSPRSLPPTISSKASAVLAAAYTAATLVFSPFLNPARALGPAFVMNRWDNHWVYWVGPLSGGAIAALLHEYVLSSRKTKDSRDLDDGDNSSMRSDEDTYDDLDKPNGPKFPSAYATYRPVAGASSSIYSAPPSALERVESIYGGTKSLYCKSPPLTRANLNRSQSVYAKSTSGPRDGLMIPKPGPLVPAQSLYPIRLGQNGCQNGNRETQSGQPLGGPPSQSAQNHNSTNQNMQNQLQQCTQSIYGIRGISTGLSTRENGIYGVSTGSTIYGRAPAPPPSSQNSQQSGQSGQSSIQNHQPPQPPSQQQQQQQQQPQQQQQQQQLQNGPLSSNSDNGAPRRPESMYGHVSRRSDDSAYGSYQSSTRGNYGKVPGPPGPPNGPPQYRDQGRPSTAGPLQQSQSVQSNFQRNSPNPQY